MSLDIEPEHHHSRLARSTCCQRPVPLPPERSVRLTDGGGACPLPSVLETFQTYRDWRSAVNPSRGPLRRPKPTRKALLTRSRAVCVSRRAQPDFGAQNAREISKSCKRSRWRSCDPSRNLVPEWKFQIGTESEVANLAAPSYWLYSSDAGDAARIQLPGNRP